MQTLTEWLAAGQYSNTCLSASGAAPLTYAGLRKLASSVEHTLNAVGIGRNDRVAPSPCGGGSGLGGAGELHPAFF